jgi:short-subunit dehydrogenase
VRLAGEGAKVVLAARDSERLEALVDECRTLGAKAVPIPTDVGDESQCKRMIDRTLSEFGQVDMLVNNAGIGVGAKLVDLPDLALFKRVVDVDFFGAVYGTYHALPHLLKTRGRIVNISSLGGRLPIPYNTSYVASKHALIGFSDSLRMELADTGVSVTVVCPYWVVTEFHERFMNKEGLPTGPRGRGIYTKGTMTADRCARIVLDAAWKRKREVLMAPGPIAMWLKLIAPSVVDRFIVKAFMGPAIRRVSAARRT